MGRTLSSGITLEGLRKEAKRWLKALRAGDADARERLQRAWPSAPAAPGLREVQYALAREFDCAGWIELGAKVRDIGRATADPLPTALVDEWLAAAGAGNATRVAELLDAHPALLDARGGEGMRTALHRTVFGGQLGVMQWLLERGADPDIRCDGDHATPLHFACEKARLDMIRALVEAGADTIGDGDLHELTVIGWATVFGSAKPEVVEYLLAHGARHTVASAIVVGDVEALRAAVRAEPAALERRMDLANRHRHPLHLAVVKGQRAALEALVDLGANLESSDAAGLTALEQAALQGERGMAELLRARGATVRLPAAIALGLDFETEQLLAAGPGAVRPGGPWGTLIVRVAERGGARAIQHLVRAGADVNVADDPLTAVDGARGYTALHAAAFHGNLEAARTLLELGANPCARDDRYAGTPAGWAAYAGHAEVRDLVVRAPQDVFGCIEFGVTERLGEALDRDPRGLERAFGAYVSVPSRPDQWWPEPWWTPLVYAVVEGNVPAVRILLERRANARVRAPDGRHLIDLASERGHDEVVVLLQRHQEARRRPGVVLDDDPPEADAASVDAFLRAALPPRDSGHAGGDLTRAAAMLAADPALGTASIHTAATVGDVDALRRFLAADPEAANAKGGPYGWDPLTCLCFSRFLRFDAARGDAFVATAEALLEAGANANTGFTEDEQSPHPSFETVLYGACGVAHHAGVTRVLLAHGADANDGEVTYHTPETYDNAALHALVEHGTLRADSLATLLLRKCDWHDEAGVRYLLDHGADADRMTIWHRTALQQAIVRDNVLGIIEAMLDHGADPTRPSAHGTALAWAVRRGRADVIAACEQRGRAVELAGLDALLLACTRGDDTRARTVAAQDPMSHVSLQREAGRYLAQFAGNDNAAGLACLLALGLPVDARLAEGDGYYEVAQDSTALHVAAWRARQAALALLLAHGADPNRLDGRGRSPLQLAVRAATASWWTRRRSTEGVRALLDAGARREGVPLPTGWDDLDAVLRSHGMEHRA